MSEETSISLLQRAGLNEPEAWKLLVDLYCPLVYWRCRSHWKFKPADAEDVGQDVFEILARKLAEFQRQRCGSFRRWLLTITDNKCKDFLRKQPACYVASGGSEVWQTLQAVADPFPTVTHGENNGHGEENRVTPTSPPTAPPTAPPCEPALLMQEAIQAVENEFSTRDWQIFWQIAVENRHRQHVAEAFGVNCNIVYLAYSRIRSRLREEFQGYTEDQAAIQTVTKSQ